MREVYKKETEVFYYDADFNVIKEGIIDGAFMGEDEGFGLEYEILTREGEIENFIELYVNKDKKQLLLQILDDANKNESYHKLKMAYYIERSNIICWILGELDKNINIKQELENYRKENKNG